MSPAENMPDFDKMSPEEMMAWMESLAKRQGATEGFTTAADMSIAEVDPDTVTIDEPGYVPSEGKSKGQAVTPEPTKPAAAPPPPPPAAPPPVPQPAAEIEPPPVLEPMASDEEELVETEIGQPAEEGAMAWLESLAADTGGLPELDLSALGAEIEPIAAEPAEAANPIAWLENLAESQGVPTSPEEPPAPVAETPTTETGDPFAGGVDPMTWLESLAKRQGVKDEELLTQANLDVPVPDSVVDEGPGYTDYSVDVPTKPETPEAAPQAVAAQPAGELDPSELESPADWLDSLASGQGFGLKPSASAEQEHLSDEDMKKALATGQDIPPDQMEAWFNRQLDRGFERDEPELDEEEELELGLDPEAPAVPAALPDWLSEMAPAEPPPMPQGEQQAFVDKIVEPPAVPDMPDWLQEEVSAHSDLDLDIFAPETPAAPASASTPDIDKEVDRSDPWVEAFDHEQGIITLPDVPGAPAALEPAALEPEEELPAGQPETVPDWLSETAAPEAAALEVDETPDWLETPEEEAVPLSADDMPDWLKEVGAEIELAEVPDWLKETADTEEQGVIASPTPAPATTTPVTVPSIAPVPASPAPVPAAATISDTEAAEVLTSARSQADSNVDGSLAEYERLVRANAQLEAVAGDLGSLVKKNEKNPAVYRVLGDALMRQGQLQAALDTYRSALNLL